MGNKGGRSVFTEQIHSKQIYQRIGSLALNVKTVRYSSTLSTLMTVLVIKMPLRPVNDSEYRRPVRAARRSQPVQGDDTPDSEALAATGTKAR